MSAEEDTVERRRDVRELRDEIALLREVVKGTARINEMLVHALKWNAITTGIVMIVFLAVALIAMGR